MQSFRHLLPRHSLIIFLLLSGLILRLLLSLVLLDPQFSKNDDLVRYQDWGKVGYQKGISSTYDYQNTSFGIYANNQMPGTAYLNISMYALYRIFSEQISQSSYDIFIKLPSILSDIFISVLIYSFVLKQANKKNALIASALFLFNPVVIYNSSVWGQTDSLNNLFFYLSLVFLINKKYFLSLLMIAFSLYIKLSILPFVPFIFLIILKQNTISLKKLISLCVLVIFIILAITFPLSSNPVSWLYQFFVYNSKGELQHITNYAFNFWAVIFNPDSFALVPDSSQIFFGLTLSSWGYIIFSVFFAIISFKLFKSSEINSDKIFKLLILIAFTIFLFLPRMHERYLYPIFPLLATYIGLTSKNYLSYLFLSALNFINLYIVWHPTNFLPTFFTNILVHSKARLSISILTTLIFFYLLNQLFKRSSQDSVD